MGVNSQPESSTSKRPAASSTQAVLDFLRIGAALEDARPKPVEKADDQPSVESLAKLGIKVRDFAYESTLPPIKPFRFQPRPVAAQNQVAGPSSSRPSSRALKRTRQDGTEVEDLGYGFVMGVARVAPENGGPRPRKLQRMGTEGSLLPEGLHASLPSRRENATLNFDDETALRAAAYDMFGGSQPPDSHSQGYSQQSQGYSQGYSQGNSQETDGIPTPVVTPNGSLVWTDSPQRNNDSPLVPTEPASECCSTTSMRLSPLASPTPKPKPLRRASPLLPQPLGTGTPTPPASPQTATAPLTINTATPPPPAFTHMNSGMQPLLRTFSSLSTFSSPLSEPPPSAPQPPKARTPSPPPRYQLRKRTGAPASPARSTKRRRPAPRREESLTLTIQS
ncbi:hypothetical protein K438DRAFT_1968144 [Mycena galopus ATCC 62051]|nr:hypothetical protein K438DRAFT_1968144 [Mycena galopus ATCC 62051]